MSEQANVDCAAGFGVRLIGCADDAVLPIGIHGYAEALGCCVLVDKTMFIADVLDCDASLWCAVDRGFGKSMNLSMLRLFWSVLRSVAPVGARLPMLRFGMQVAGVIG